MHRFQERKGVLLNEQNGFKKRVGEPRISEKAVLTDRKTRHKNLTPASEEYCNAWCMILHSWILESFDMFAVAGNFKNFVHNCKKD